MIIVMYCFIYRLAIYKRTYQYIKKNKQTNNPFKTETYKIRQKEKQQQQTPKQIKLIHA